MAIFVNPAATYRHPDNGWPVIVGTDQADVFHFGGAFAGGPDVVFGLKGNDVFNGGLNVRHTTYYDMPNDSVALRMFGHRMNFWEGGDDTFHIGEGDKTVGGRGHDWTILHGGHYAVPARVFVQDNATAGHDRVVIAGSEHVMPGQWRISGTRRDDDGRGFTSALEYVTLASNTWDPRNPGDPNGNPVTDEQLVTIHTTNTQHHKMSNGGDAWRPVMIDHWQRAFGDADMQRFVDGWDVIV